MKRYLFAGILSLVLFAGCVRPVKAETKIDLRLNANQAVSQIVDAMKPLANSLGQSATYTYGIAKKDAIISGYCELGGAGVSLMFIIWGILLFTVVAGKYEDEKRPRLEDRDTATCWKVLGVVLIIISTIAIIPTLCCAAHALGNPDQAALDYIIQAAKSCAYAVK